MSMKRSAPTAASVLVIGLSVWAAGPLRGSAQIAHPAHEHGTHSGRNRGAGAGTITSDAPTAHRSAHGGQMAVVGPHRFEVVFLPKETRVYVHGTDHQPISARTIRGQLSMKVRGNDKVFRFPLKHVAPRPGAPGQDYLAAAVDVSRIRDGQMTVTFDLENLPNPHRPQATFSQVFVLSIPPVTVAPLEESDRPRIAEQEVCVVSGGRLGSMGTSVKVLIGDQPVYLCCRGCLGRVEENPRLYLEKIASSGSRPAATASAERITVTTAAAADQAAIHGQGTCPVMGTPLGKHGTPIKVALGDQTLFLCCKGCLAKVEKDPRRYLPKAAELRGQR